MSEVTIEVQRREALGKGAVGRLRAQDLVPAVVYGGDREPVAIQIPKKTLLTLFKQGGHENRIFLLKMAGTTQSRHAMVRDLQMDATTHEITHLDFQRVMMDQKLRVKVHVVLEGTAYGVKTEGGMLDFVARELEIECLPGAIPHEIRVDVTGVRVGHHLEAKDLEMPAGVTYVGPPDLVIAAVSHARVEAAETVAAAAAVAEPEVIKKGKGEEPEES